MSAATPVWVLREVILALHEKSLAVDGGIAGIRDEGMFDSALSRPENLFAYDKPTLFEMAAAYAYGIAKNHPFLDGNKRTAFITAIVFLEVNGHTFVATEADAALRTLALAASEMTEQAYALWLEANSHRASRPSRRRRR
ncbi:type II toxin-antitoxin system death-on-curing family toxin [Opitutaceae bacterium TAV4]|nr:type II toxin-antitoxin system death-on-curing family toxin [Opitutaceae bacterium TAV4]RRJ98773.1 type II toxin-antitoxin system death-on-curing family toxin [Opitutaceae bacterium TAV3]